MPLNEEQNPDEQTRTHRAAVNTEQSARDQTMKSLASWTASVTAPVLQCTAITVHASNIKQVINRKLVVTLAK